MDFRIVHRISADIVGAGVVEHPLARRVKVVQVAPMLRVGGHAEGDGGLEHLAPAVDPGLLDMGTDALADDGRLVQRGAGQDQEGVLFSYNFV